MKNSSFTMDLENFVNFLEKPYAFQSRLKTMFENFFSEKFCEWLICFFTCTPSLIQILGCLIAFSRLSEIQHRILVFTILTVQICATISAILVQIQKKTVQNFFSTLIEVCSRHRKVRHTLEEQLTKLLSRYKGRYLILTGMFILTSIGPGFIEQSVCVYETNMCPFCFVCLNTTMENDTWISKILCIDVRTYSQCIILNLIEICMASLTILHFLWFLVLLECVKLIYITFSEAIREQIGSIVERVRAIVDAEKEQFERKQRITQFYEIRKKFNEEKVYNQHMYLELTKVILFHQTFNGYVRIPLCLLIGFNTLSSLSPRSSKCLILLKSYS